MDQSSTFARHFSRLVWLLMNESGSVDEQKMALRALVQVSKVGAIELATSGGELHTREAIVPGVLTGVHDVAAQMAAHSMRSLRVEEGAGPADLVGLARIVALPADGYDGGIKVGEQLAAMGTTGITFVPLPESDYRSKEVVVAAASETAEVAEAQDTPAGTAESPTAATPITDSVLTPVATPAVPAPAAVVPTPPRPSLEARKISDASAALLAQLSGRPVSTLPPEELLAALEKTAAARDVEPTTKFLDDLVSVAELSARTAKPKVVAEILHTVMAQHAKERDAEIKGVYGLAIRRLSKPALLRAVASLILKAPEKKRVVYEVLAAAAEDGAEAVIEQVGQARSEDERKAFVELLVELKDAVPALIRMMGDSRWFVVRNAADLLGEMVATKAESALVGLLRHTDDRVRRSATNALLKLGTPEAVKGVYESVNDQSPEVRMQVASSIATRKDSKTSATLIRALEGESDGDVQLAMIAALGKVATPDAVQKLVKLAEAENRIFRKKDSTMRVAAVLALGEARTPAALNALKALVEDKDREVRDTATRTLAQVGR